MESVLYYLNERDKLNLKALNPDNEDYAGTIGSGYFIDLLPRKEVDGKTEIVYIHHLNELLINENLYNAGLLIDKTIQNLPQSISKMSIADVADNLLVTNIVRTQNLKKVNLNGSDANERTLYFIGKQYNE